MLNIHKCDFLQWLNSMRTKSSVITFLMRFNGIRNIDRERPSAKKSSFHLLSLWDFGVSSYYLCSLEMKSYWAFGLQWQKENKKRKEHFIDIRRDRNAKSVVRSLRHSQKESCSQLESWYETKYLVSESKVHVACGVCEAWWLWLCLPACLVFVCICITKNKNAWAVIYFMVAKN